MYPALLPLMRTPQLPVVDCTDAPADLNGLVRFAERRNLVCARVPSHFKRSLRTAVLNLQSEVVPLLQSSASGGGEVWSVRLKQKLTYFLFVKTKSALVQPVSCDHSFRLFGSSDRVETRTVQVVHLRSSESRTRQLEAETSNEDK